jgi:hypothetical protein
VVVTAGRPSAKPRAAIPVYKQNPGKFSFLYTILYTLKRGQEFLRKKKLTIGLRQL